MIFIILYGLIVLSFSIAPCAQELVSIGLSPCCWRWFLWRKSHWVLGRLSAAVPTSPDQFGKPRCIQVLLKLSKTSTVETHNLLIISIYQFYAMNAWLGAAETVSMHSTFCESTPLVTWSQNAFSFLLAHQWQIGSDRATWALAANRHGRSARAGFKVCCQTSCSILM